jgi:hypothetical protein
MGNKSAKVKRDATCYTLTFHFVLGVELSTVNVGLIHANTIIGIPVLNELLLLYYGSTALCWALAAFSVS